MAVGAPVGAGDERVADAEDRLSDAEAVRLRVEHRLVPEPAKRSRSSWVAGPNAWR